MAVEERRIQIRRDTAANWATHNPVLASGEWGYDQTNKVYKMGDGTTAWGTLPVQESGGSSVAIEDSGVQLTAEASRLNFTGAGVTLSDTGGGTVAINVPGSVDAVQSVQGQTGVVVLTAADVGAEATGAVSTHNSSGTAHSDIRTSISGLDGRVTTLESSSATTAFANVVYAGSNTAARPDAVTVYWKNWPSELTPANGLDGDLVFSAGA